MNPPALVAANSALLGSLGVWHLVSKNKFAANGGCADAATKRNRLGHTGIPVFDELKSHVGAYTDEQGTRRYVVAHCRGHQLRRQGLLQR